MKECTREEKQTRYNYVLVNFGGDYLEPVFHPLKNYPFVRVYDRAFDGNALLQKLCFLHWSKKLNRRIRLPGKRIWYRKMTEHDFAEDKPCCYVFYGGKYITEDRELFSYIKKKNPNNKCVVFCYDLISKKHWDIEKVKKSCDRIVTYDPGEAEKYQIDLLQAFMYGAICEVTEPEAFENDVYFLGFAKDRLDQIYQTYQTLSTAGLRCNFLICGVSADKQIKGEGLHYITPISYRENVENVKRSKCILELMQGGSDAPTLRTEEAHVYRRKLLTNHLNLVNQPYYDCNNMRVFSAPEQIDIDFLKTPIDYSSFDDSFDYSPYQLISYLENLLGGN